MSAEHDHGKRPDPRGATTALPAQMEFAFARATGVSVENLKRMRALRRAFPAPRPRPTETSEAARGGG